MIGTPPQWAGAAVVLGASALVALAPRPLMPPLKRNARSLELGVAALSTGVCTLWLLQGALAWHQAVAAALAAGVLAAVVLFDLRWMLIPDLYWLLVLIAAVLRPLGVGWTELAAGAAVAGGLLWGVQVWFRRRRGVDVLGFGDVKLMAAIGALTGPISALWLIVLASLGGLLYAALLKRAANQPIPFGSAAGVVAIGAIWLSHA